MDVISQKFYSPRRDGDGIKIKEYVKLSNSYLHFSVSLINKCIRLWNYNSLLLYTVIIDSIWGIKSVFEFFIQWHVNILGQLKPFIVSAFQDLCQIQSPRSTAIQQL